MENKNLRSKQKLFYGILIVSVLLFIILRVMGSTQSPYVEVNGEKVRNIKYFVFNASATMFAFIGSLVNYLGDKFDVVRKTTRNKTLLFGIWGVILIELFRFVKFF